MERIQSAIEQARHARQGTEKDIAPGNTSAPTGNWAELPRISPNPSKLLRNHIVAHKSDAAAIPFDMMRAKLVQAKRRENWNRICITSPGPASGKTTLCLNLAFSLARQRDLRVLVVDFDLRRPSICRMLGLSEQPMFSDVLNGAASEEDHLLCYGDNLMFAINSKPAENPAELLQTRQAGQVIDRLEVKYSPDIILFDLPPLLIVDDAMAFLDQVDCALLIGAAERVTFEEVERCQQDIQSRTNLLGMVLNKCRYLDKTEHYGY